VNTAIVGRKRETAEGSGFLDEVARGRCGLVLRGEPGIGKTTIWSAVLADADARGHRTLVARPSEPESELPFAVLTDLLAAIGDDALAALPPPQREGLQQALRRVEHSSVVDPVAVALGTRSLLQALSATSPTIVAIDDLQWVDPPSLRALTFAYRRLEDAPVGLLATVRAGHENDLTDVAHDPVNAFRELEIGGLDRRELAELILGRTGRAFTPSQLERLAGLSRGSPYYALELAATGDVDFAIPETLAGALRARLAALPGSARRTALVLATLGRFDASAVGTPRGEAVSELIAAGIVDERLDDPWFSHPLLASTLLSMHPPEERRSVHLLLADKLTDPDERALHLGHATTAADEAVASELEEAAARLDARGAPEAAATLVERAGRLTPETDIPARTRRLIRAADLYQAAGEGRTRTLALLEQLAAELPPGLEHARVLVRLGWLGAELDTLTAPAAVTTFERALEEAGAEPAIAAAAHVALARMRGLGGDFQGWLHHAELSVAAGAVPEPRGILPSPHGELGFATFLAGRGLDEELFAEGIRLEEGRPGVGEPYHSPRLQLGWVLLHEGRLAAAREIITEQLGLAIELERVRSVAGCLVHLVELEVRAGDLSKAEEHAAEFARLDRQLRGASSEEWYPSAVVAVHLGRVEDARRMLEAGIAYSCAIESTVWRAHHLWALGHLELSLDNFEPAREILVPLLPMLRDLGLGEWSVHPVHPDAIEALVALGELEEAAALTDELEEFGRRLDRPWALATASRSRALIASAGGSLDEALVEAERAVAAHGRLEWPFEHARTLLVSGAILRRAGRRRDAAARLTDARSLFDTLGSPLWLAKVEAEERRLGGRRSAGDSLTSAEERVAELAGQGLRNAEIAAQLFVTPKTVEWTLSRVYRKLGVRSRTELASRLPGQRGTGSPGEP
jgi:DNA-binding CsgD family transcriptional regulator